MWTLTPLCHAPTTLCPRAQIFERHPPYGPIYRFVIRSVNRIERRQILVCSFGFSRSCVWARFLAEALTIVSCACSSRLFSEEHREGRARKKFDRDITHAIGSAYSLTHSLTWHGVRRSFALPCVRLSCLHTSTPPRDVADPAHHVQCAKKWLSKPRKNS